MSAVGSMQDRQERPPYVRFKREAAEDREATVRDKEYRAKDIDYALVTAPYSKDVHVQIASEWLDEMGRQARQGRIPQKWHDDWEEAFAKWQKGEEMPLNGTAIRAWGVISPAQKEMLVAMHILTVEDLAQANDEGLRRIGMGAGELRDKAKAWLSQTKDKGPLTIENAALKAENNKLKAQVEHLERRVQELAERIEIYQRGALDRPAHLDSHFAGQVGGDAISATDILPNAERPAAPAKKRERAAAI